MTHATMGSDECSYSGCEEDGEYTGQLYGGETTGLCEDHAKKAHNDESGPEIVDPEPDWTDSED